MSRLRRVPRCAQPQLHVLVAGGVLAVIGSTLILAQGPPAIESIRGTDAVAGEVLVKFKEPHDRGDVLRAARDASVERLRQVGGSGVHLFRSRRMTAARMLEVLASRADVAYVEPNYVVRITQSPSDPRFPELWGLLNTGQQVNGGASGTPGADIGAFSAWQVSTGTSGVVVGVVDTGIDYTHPDLVANAWSAPTEFSVTIGGTVLTCPAGSHGYNAMANSCDPMDDHYHGTHVAGTISASGNNGMGVVGVNWTTPVMGLKFIGPDGSGTLADAIDAIEFAIQAKAAFAATGEANIRVLSNSWGGRQFSQALFDAIVRAGQHEMLFVAAAGNDGMPNDFFSFYPAGYPAPNVVAVLATDNADRRASFSNYSANTVHLGAPGVGILSTVTGGDYAYASGTSMATPHVSGAAALVLSRCDLDTAALKKDLLDNVDDVPALDNYTVTGGRLNADRAIRACSALPAVPSGLAAAPENGEVTLTWAEAPGATAYRVRRRSAAGGPYAVIGETRALRFVDSGVTNDVSYYYVVSSLNMTGESADSAEVEATPRVPSDLVVSTLTVPTKAGAGEQVVVGDTVLNRGAGRAGASTTRFFLSANLALDGSDTPLPGARAVPELPPGAVSAGSTSITIPEGAAVGSYYLIAKTDADMLVVETSEGNNTSGRTLAIGPDLVISDMRVPFSVTAGIPVVVTVTTKNQGGGQAVASVVRFYLSMDVTLDQLDVTLGGSLAVPALATGASCSGSAAVTIPSSTAAGNYFLLAQADADHVVAETSDSNNVSVRAVQTGADLIVSSLTVTFTAAGQAQVSETTRNQGTAAAGVSTTRFYLSTDSSYDAGDAALGGSIAVPALAAGGSASGAIQLAFPPGLPVGTYYLVARADADGTVQETSESNNATLRAVACGADLVIQSLGLQPTTVAGTVLATDTVRNQGSAAAAGSTVRFYLSSNATLDASDTLLAESRAVPPLAAGQSSSGSTSLTIPLSTPAGTYYVFALADADEAVPESSEGNNASGRTLPVGADLVVGLLQLPYNVIAGTQVQLTLTVRNQGNQPCGPSTTRFYLSANLTLDAGDVALDASVAVAALQPGTGATASATITIPGTTTPGSWFLLAKADADEAVAEPVETNNQIARAVSVAAK